MSGAQPHTRRTAADAASEETSGKTPQRPASHGKGRRIPRTASHSGRQSARRSAGPQPKARRTASESYWKGSWIEGESPFFEDDPRGYPGYKAPGGGRASLSGLQSYPLLPRWRDSPHAFHFEEERKFMHTDPKMRLQRYHDLRSGYNLTTVLNNPLNPVDSLLPEPEPLYIAPFPGLSDSEIGLGDVREYARRMAPFQSMFHANHPLPVPSPFAMPNPRESRTPVPAARTQKSKQEQLLAAEREAEANLQRCLETVPDIYFRPDFRVSNPSFFADLADRPDSMLLQEKLSHYLDLVEINLLKQISARAPSFFTALVNIQDLNNEVGKGTKTIQSIRSRIDVLRQQLVVSSMLILHRKKRQRNALMAVKRLEQVSAVVNAQNTIKSLIADGNFTAALNLVETTQFLLNSELKGVKCLRFAGRKLEETRVLVEKLLYADFGRLAAQGYSLLDPSEQEQQLQLIIRLKRYSTLTEAEDSQLRQLVQNMARLSKLSLLIAEYRSQLTTVIIDRLKDLITWQLEAQNQAPTGIQIPSYSDTQGESGNRMATQIKDLGHSQFIRMLDGIFRGLLFIVNRMAVVEQLVKSEVSKEASGAQALEPDSQPTSSTDKTQFLSNIHELTCSLCEFAHTRCSRIIGIRAEIHAELELSQLREFFDTTLRFIVDCEKLCHHTFYGLRGTLLSQAKAFLEKFHLKSVNQLASSLEKEQWQRVGVPRHYQIIIDRSFERPKQTSSQAPAPATRSYSNWDDASDDETENAVEAQDDHQTEQKESRVLFVEVRESTDGKKKGSFDKYAVVQSLLVLVDMVSKYIECAVQLQAVGADILNRLVDLLKLFNSRTCQLVLGAGAMHLAGLRSINAKHLALSAQCLGLILSQIPIIRKKLSGRLPPKHQVLLASLDRVSQDYQNHQGEIFLKLANIVGDLIENSCKRLMKEDWACLDDAALASRPPEQKIKPHQSVKTLMKQTSSLHRVLSDLLPVAQRDQVFGHICKSFSETFCKYLSRIGSTSPDVRRHVSVNVEHILKRLRALNGMNASTCKELDIFVT